MREYKDEDENIIWLYLVMAERDRTSFHPPEYCYLGGGKTELLEKEVIDIALAEETLTVNKLIFQMPAGKQVILVWYMAGDKSFASFYKQQLYLVLNIIRGKESGGAMVRLSTYFSQNNKEEKLNSLKQFLKDLQPHLIN
jgi:EpsI family protein